MLINALKKTALTLSLLLTLPAWADWPVSISDSFTMHQSRPERRLNVLANDTGDELRITAVNDWTSQGGRATAIDNLLTYTPPQNFAGDDTFWYVITDNKGRTNAAKVTVTIKPQTSPYPAPQPDAVKTQKDTSIRIDVINNDISNPSPIITGYNAWSQRGGRITEVDGSSLYGTDLKNRSQLIYTPPAGFVGTDTFWYNMKNFADLDRPAHAAKVTVQVTKENSAGAYPVAKPDLITVDTLCFRGPEVRYPYCRSKALNILSNDTGKNLKLSIGSAWSLRGANVLIIKATEGSGPVLSYTPKTFGGDGEDKIWYVIEDEVGRKNWGVVTLNVITRG